MSNQPSSPSDSTDASLESYVRRARVERKQAAPTLNYPILEPDIRARMFTRFGVRLGFFASLLFAIISQIFNILMLPGVPLYRSLIDPLLVVVQIVVIGTLFCLLSVSSIKVQNRMAAAIGLLILIAIFGKFYLDYGTLLGTIMQGIGFLYKFLLPILFILFTPVPFVLLIRWVAGKQVNNYYRPFHAQQRFIPVLVLFAVFAMIGSLFVFSSSERQAVRAMDMMMKEALATQTEEDLPIAVRDVVGTPFFPHASGPYHLKAAHNPLPNRVYEDGTPFVMDISVTAEFSSGYWLTCDFARSTGKVLNCRSDYMPQYRSNNR